MADLLRAADMAEIAGVRQSDVGHWKMRYDDFPAVAGKVDGVVAYDRDEALAWLKAYSERRLAKAEAVLRKAEKAVGTAMASLETAQTLHDRLH